MATPILQPTSELVAQAWIATIADLGAQVGLQLPPDDSTWAATGFVMVTVVGGSPDIDVPIRKPVVQVDCWTVDPGSNKPPWNFAAALSARIYAACYDRRLGSFGRPLTLSAAGEPYPGAQVMSAYALTEPRRAYGDVADYSGSTFDLQLTWRAVATPFPID